MSKRYGARAIILNEDKILLMHRIKNGHEYYVFPGGGVEKGETAEQAVLREVYEETSTKAHLDRLLYRHIYDDGTSQFFYLCNYLSGIPKLGEGNESEEMKKNPTNSFEPLWYETAKIPQLLLYPLEIRDWLLEDLERGFSSTPKVANIKISEVRHAL